MKAADIKKRGWIERSSTEDDIAKQKASAKERRDLALQQLESKSTAASANALKAVKERDFADQEMQAKASEIVAFEQTMKDMDSLLDKKLVDEFHQLEDAVSKATKDVVEHGKDATAYMAQKARMTSSGASYMEEYEVSYGYVLESATAQLKKFKEKHEEVIKDLDTYKEAAKKHDELKAQLTKLTHAYEEAEQKTKQATLLASGVVPKENAVEKLRIEEQYQRELAEIDKKAQQQKEADEKKAADEKKKAEEEQKKIEKQRLEEEKKKLEAERKSKISKLEQEREKIMQQDKQTAVQKLEAHKKEMQAAKELAEAEKKAADVIADWKDNPQQAIGKWRKEQNQAQREAEKEQKQQAKNAAQAKSEADKLAKKLFNKDGELRRGANAFDIGRFAEASDYLGFKNVSDD